MNCASASRRDVESKKSKITPGVPQDKHERCPYRYHRIVVSIVVVVIIDVDDDGVLQQIVKQTA
jgi:hypothetical protein